MTTTTATANKKPQRTCRWISSRVLSRLASGEGAILEIEADGTCTPYMVRPEVVGDVVTAWHMTKPEQDEEGFEVPVAYAVAGDLSACNCPSSVYRPRIVCRHRAGLRAAFAALGYQP